MTKFLKSAVFICAIVAQLFFSSCLKNEGDERTQETERIEIARYLLVLEETGTEVDTTESGIYYIIHKAGSGVYPETGDTCFIEYVGYFIDGSIFEVSQNSYKDGIRELIYNETELFDGFEEAIGLLKDGGEGTFIIPSKLAFGDSWNDFIPPYTPLVYDINLHEINTKTTE